MTEVEIRENGANVTASPGDRIVVRVTENATTGYQWVTEDVPDLLELESSDLIAPRDARLGAGGERRVVFRARQGGQAKIRLTLRRPWEAEKAADRFEAVVTIT
jgi:inhibitor of cysteine peptidase